MKLVATGALPAQDVDSGLLKGGGASAWMHFPRSLQAPAQASHEPCSWNPTSLLEAAAPILLCFPISQCL